MLDSPADYRGSVRSMEAGRSVSCDRHIGSEWRHIAAVRRYGALGLYIDEERTAVSDPFDPAAYNLSAGAPLRIGSGEGGSFHGQIRDVRVYRRALDEAEIAGMASEAPPGVGRGA